MKIIVFFTLNIGLVDWIERGLQFRELNYWRALREKGIDLEIVTFDDRSAEIEKYLEGHGLDDVTVHKLGKLRAGSLKAFSQNFLTTRRAISRSATDEATIIKTNQVKGWLIGFLLAVLTRSSFVVRFGYLPSQLYKDRRSYIKYLFALCSENLAIMLSSRTVVCGESSFALLCRRNALMKSKILQVFNYITAHHSVVHSAHHVDKTSAIFVGRLEPEKNPELAILAALKVGFNLTIAGDGSLRSELERRYSDYSKINFIGNVDFDRLVIEYKKHKFFFITSFNEGMPKALMEAISSGCYPIGFDSPGVGVLLKKYGTSCSNPSNVAFLLNIDNLLEIADQQGIIKTDTTTEFLKEFSLERLVDVELALLESIKSEKHAKV